MKQLLNNKGYKRTFVILHLIALVTLVLDYGFPTPSWVAYIILVFYTIILVNGVFFTLVRQFYDKKKSEFKVRVFDLMSITFIIYCLVQQYYTHSFFNIVSDWLRWAIILKLVREFGTSKINYKRVCFFLCSSKNQVPNNRNIQPLTLRHTLSDHAITFV